MCSCQLLFYLFLDCVCVWLCGGLCMEARAFTGARVRGCREPVALCKYHICTLLTAESSLQLCFSKRLCRLSGIAIRTFCGAKSLASLLPFFPSSSHRNHPRFQVSVQCIKEHVRPEWTGWGWGLLPRAFGFLLFLFSGKTKRKPNKSQ